MTIRQVIGKTKSTSNSFPKRMIIDSIEFFDQNKIENRFNKLVTEIALKLESTYYEKVSKFCYCYRRSF